jgi:hypothetical protein
MSEFQNNTQRGLVACSLWMHIGYIGAVALAAGLLQVLDGESPWLSALALVFFGGVLAAASWCRSLIALEYAEPASAVATDAPSESTSHAFSRQTGPGAIAMPSPFPLQSNRRRDRDLSHPTPE